jgi:UDP-2,4-diacetamido-2,4,6-trideoxy-beta-L-altropyranose hydrolase
MQIAVRADASNAIGIGHVARCLALAQELKRRGAEITFVSRRMNGDMVEAVAAKGHRVKELAGSAELDFARYPWLGVPAADDAAATIAALHDERPDLLIVDHYGIDVAWECMLRPFVDRLFVIDDLAERSHDCDILLDQNYRSNEANPHPVLPAGARRLLGPRYALLRDEFGHAREAGARDGRDPTGRILICFGGGDALDFTSAAVRAVEPLLPMLKQVDVIVGPSNPNLEKLSAYVCPNPKLNLVTGTSDLSPYMLAADLVVGAGGSMCWERFCLGAPTLAFGVAENQRLLLEPLIRDAYLLGVPFMPLPDEATMRSWLSCALSSRSLLLGMSQRGRALVDGQGIVRVADALYEQSQPTLHGQSPTIDVLCTDQTHPVIDALRAWCERQKNARLCFSRKELRGGDFLFLISCHFIVGDDIRSRYEHSLVIHASDLPAGRGWSPLVWQLLEGRRSVAVSLIDAADPVDSGAIWSQQTIVFDGSEDFQEINAKLFECEISLMDWALENCARSQARAQAGEPSFYRRRNPGDSLIDAGMTIADAFDRIRVCDPVRYPAHFELRNSTYAISLKKIWKTER